MSATHRPASSLPEASAETEARLTKSDLVKVLTDLFAARPHHTPDEIRHYEEIMLRMLPDAESPVLADVAAKLAAHPQAPLPVLEMLIDRDSAIMPHTRSGAGRPPELRQPECWCRRGCPKPGSDPPDCGSMPGRADGPDCRAG